MYLSVFIIHNKFVIHQSFVTGPPKKQYGKIVYVSAWAFSTSEDMEFMW